MTVTVLKTTPEYVEFIKSKDLSVIHFFAPWAEQCQQVNDVLEEMKLLKDYDKVQFAMVEAENLPEISLKAGITAIPTILLYKNEEIIDRIEGVNTGLLTERVKYHLVNEDATPLTAELTLEVRLKRLINQAPCMVFMKGNREHPRCGFSRTMIALLDSHRAEYQTFDVLQDNTIREGLKKFSDWPTYPQVYINGEFIGGLDIVKEMSNSGNLDSMLPKKSTSQNRS
ncbi:PREDICTED: glutaredoxin-3 [Polistes dominula]|uniref:Glutaredoxin-3 n=1 Tax=Polistes dominula TaxID=743375 RepID=A0ABM1J8Q4_POLDO|nr:PREDICTED: glutaredoxin-3 [Polistes dominula]